MLAGLRQFTALFTDALIILLFFQRPYSVLSGSQYHHVCHNGRRLTIVLFFPELHSVPSGSSHYHVCHNRRRLIMLSLSSQSERRDSYRQQ